MRRGLSPFLAVLALVVDVSATPSSAYGNKCADLLKVSASHDDNALHNFEGFSDLFLDILNGVAKRNGKPEVVLSDPRWGTAELRQQQVADFCRDHQQMRLDAAIAHIYDGYRTSAGLGSLAQPGARR